VEIQIALSVKTICQNEFGLHLVGYGLHALYVLQLVGQKLYALHCQLGNISTIFCDSTPLLFLFCFHTSTIKSICLTIFMKHSDLFITYKKYLDSFHSVSTKLTYKV
jgi:hypothetical protein